jgi:hypothetical protein
MYNLAGPDPEEASVNLYQTTRFHISKPGSLYSDHLENLKSDLLIASSYAHKVGRSNKRVNKEEVCVNKLSVIETDVYTMFELLNYTFNPLKSEPLVNIIQESSSYLTGNTLLLRYKANRFMLFIVRPMWNTQIHSGGRMQSYGILKRVVHIETSGGLKG